MTTGAGTPPAGALEAIVLAAGAGARFGGGKLTSPWRNGALIDGALAAAFAAPARRVRVVTGADPDVAAACRRFADAHGQGERLEFVYARDHDQGMAASLRAGLAALPPDADGAFLFLGDMPLIPHDVPMRLARMLEAGALAAAPVFEGQRGHPVLFSATLFGDLGALEGDRGARAVLESLGDRLALVAVTDSGVLVDVDAPGDLQRQVSPRDGDPD